MLRALRVLVVFGLAGATVACGDDGASLDTTIPGTAVPVDTTLPGEPSGPLLTTLDVGREWQVGPEVNDADFGDSTRLPCDDVALNPTIARRLTPVAGIQFEPVDRSSKHLIEFLLTGEAPRLDADLQAWTDAMESCATTTPATTSAGTLTVEAFTLPPLGDQRTGFVLTADLSPGVTWHVRTAAVRVGSMASRVALTEILSTPDSPVTVSDADFVDLVETAAAKLSASR